MYSRTWYWAYHLFRFILFCAWAFAMLDWRVIQTTRFIHRDWMDWTHNHEHQYAGVVFTAEVILCTPAYALKPIFAEAVKNVEATPEQKASITHSPPPNWLGFWQPYERGKPYRFISWGSWFTYWLVPCIIWALVWKRLCKTPSKN